MNSQKKPQNPWNKNPPVKKSNKKQNDAKTTPTPSELKFKEVQEKSQAAAKKHVKDYESSSEEEELESANVIGEILKNYTKTGGSDDVLGRTKTIIYESFQPGAASCLICISRIKRESPIWSCYECYCIFHLDCIQRWSKDRIFQKKQILESQIQVKQITLSWSCPQCRNKYKLEDIPEKYVCFCQKTENPKFEPFLAPHSCGEICKKNLKPECGHKCLLLCHPGPCPPCPVTVNVKCFCGSQPPTTRRCSNKSWSCGNRCGKLLGCQKHSCSDPCHDGDCNPCSKKSLQKCLCKSEQKLRDCSSPIWQCEKVCNKPLNCGNHKCEIACHEKDACGDCPLTKQRTCPCGKTKYLLPCTEETPTCPDTCDKLLECGLHTCNLRCHKDACGLCLETVVKSCKCGLHSKEVQCYKPYSCDTKCKRIKDCNKHPCNKKCCDGNCAPCEKPCGRTLNCGNHKCASVCHRGMCYPCNQTETVACRCGETKISVSCGRRQKTRPPKCRKLCKIPPECHHEHRERHNCHFGDCPTCKQTCDKPHANCEHKCAAPCHSSVVVVIKGEKPSMPWEQTKPQIEKRSLPCPDCLIKVPVVCLGGHEKADWPCFQSAPSSCHRPCGRVLHCQNHKCTLPCHSVESAPDEIKSGTNCEKCETFCSKERPEGCTHECPRPCHPGACPPCKQMLRIRCHCGLTQPYVACNEWLIEQNREQIQSCGNQCPNNFECGHRCRENCHSGQCPNANLCKKKVKISCKCKRLKKEFSCETVRKNLAKVECDEICALKKEEQRKNQDELDEKRKKEEELRNQQELAKYQKIFEGKKKNRERRVYQEEEEENLFKKYWLMFTILGTVLLAICLFFVFQ